MLMTGDPSICWRRAPGWHPSSPAIPSPAAVLVESVAVGPFQQGVQPVDRVVDAPVQVAELGEPVRHGSDGELARVHVVDLIPADRGGDGSLRYPAHRVRAGDGVIAGVLVVVDEQHGGVAVLAPPGGRDGIRRT